MLTMPEVLREKLVRKRHARRCYCSRCNQANKKGSKLAGEKNASTFSSNAAPCDKAWHSGFQLNNAPKAEWDQGCGINAVGQTNLDVTRRGAPTRDHSSTQRSTDAVC